jgi:hypothetical protein
MGASSVKVQSIRISAQLGSCGRFAPISENICYPPNHFVNLCKGHTAISLSAAKDYLDPKGYWGDPAGNVRRMSGEQAIIATVTGSAQKRSVRRCAVSQSRRIDKQQTEEPLF